MWRQVEYSPDFLDEILRMTQEQYGSENDISNTAFLQHQYFENPAGNAVIALAVDEQTNTLAGQYVVWPMRFQVFGEVRNGANSLNTLTGKAYRGQGIFTTLAESVYTCETEMGHGFCTGVPNPNSFPGFIKKLSFCELGRLPLMLRPLKPSAMVKEFLHSDALSGVARIANPVFAVKTPKVMNNVEIVPVSHENLGLIDRFWDEVKGKYPVMNIRDGAFIRFRYLDMPRRTYYPYMALQNGKPVAFAVGRIMEVAGMQCAMLADFLMTDGGEIAAKQLLKSLLHDMQKQGASLAGCLMLDHTKESALLKRHGFFRCPKKLEPQPFPLILRVFDKELEEKGIYDLHNWFFTMGDYDVI